MGYVIATVLGLIVGSFVNVVAYRLPLGQSIVGGRSKCPGCGTQIAWYDLVPLVSFFVLNARCRNCRAKISWLYPLGEFLSGLIFIASFYFFYSLGWADLIFTAVILEIFLILFLADLKYLILPDIIMLVGLILIIIYGTLEKVRLVPAGYSILSVNNLVSAASFAALFYILWLGSKGKWIGLGDAKLAGLIGLLFGYVSGVFVLYLAVAMGGIVGLALLAATKADMKTKLPLGSFICLAATVYIFSGLNLAYKLGLEFIFR